MSFLNTNVNQDFSNFVANFIQWLFSGDLFQITGRILIIVITLLVIRIIFLIICSIFCFVSDANELRKAEENRRRNLGDGADIF